VNKTPRISVVIPSLNKAKYIGKTLDSIFEQKYSNVEVIIQDGGSVDETIEIIKKYAKKYPIKWESKKDNGQVDAVNMGLSKASGEILTFINADDFYLPGAFLEILKAYTNYPNSLWFAGRSMVINKDGNEVAKIVTFYKNLLLSLYSRFYLLITNYLMQPSVFFTKEAFKKYGPFYGNSRYILEYDFWLNIAKQSMPVVINACLSVFRISGDNISSVGYKKLLLDDQKIVNKYTKNPFIIFLHKINNYGRIISIYLINK
jgi:glycosyltransferase involved in cell wall biosynthesis